MRSYTMKNGLPSPDGRPFLHIIYRQGMIGSPPESSFH
jgi:hypothetical protein